MQESTNNKYVVDSQYVEQSATQCRRFFQLDLKGSCLFFSEEQESFTSPIY